MKRLFNYLTIQPASLQVIGLISCVVVALAMTKNIFALTFLVLLPLLSAEQVIPPGSQEGEDDEAVPMGFTANIK